jgi:acyl carrier protein
MLDLPAGTLTGSEKLQEIEGWDSLSTVAYILMVDKEFGLPLSGSRVAQCQTVEELLGLLKQAPGKALAA